MRNFFLILLFITCTKYTIGQSISDELEIKDLMKKQENCWNLGDIPCFMEGYWYSDSLTFIGSNGVTYGFQNTLDNYLRKYPDKQTMGELKFELVSIQFLEENIAYVIGKWNLKRDEKGNIGGSFTLLWKKINENWVIISDHSS